MPYVSRLQYIKLVRALAVAHSDVLRRKHKKSKKKNVAAVINTALTIEDIEYMANGARWRSRNGIRRSQMGTGTCGNEGDHFALKSWGRNVMKQSLQRVHVVLGFFLMNKCLSFFVPRGCCFQRGLHSRQHLVLALALAVHVDPTSTEGMPHSGARVEQGVAHKDLRRPSVCHKVGLVMKKPSILKRPARSAAQAQKFQSPAVVRDRRIPY